MSGRTRLDPAKVMPIVIAAVFLYFVASVAAARSFADLKAETFLVDGSPILSASAGGTTGNRAPIASW